MSKVVVRVQQFKTGLTAGVLVVALAFGYSVALPVTTSGAATAPGLGTATSFAVLAGSTVTNTGPSVVNGDLGVSPGAAVTGFPPGMVVPPGTIHTNDALAGTAQADALTAYNNLAGQPCDVDLTLQDLGGRTLNPGVYCFANSAQLTGLLTLDFGNNPADAVFVFQIGSTITTASNSSISLIGALADSCNVFWQVGSSATLGTGTAFAGTVLASTSITANTGVNVRGRLLASTGAVTLDNNTINPACVPPPPPPVIVPPVIVPPVIVPPPPAPPVTAPPVTTPPVTAPPVTTPPVPVVPPPAPPAPPVGGGATDGDVGGVGGGGGTGGTTDGGDGTTGGGTTGGGGSTGGTGGATDGGSVPGEGDGPTPGRVSGPGESTSRTDRPALPVTGSSDLLWPAGVLAVILGSLCLNLSAVRHRRVS